ncbi:MAG: hypothetical protein AAF917_02565 [Pseudomonadota bacterium]
MSGVGRFLEFSIRTPDILDSLSFYKNLGFRELTTGDMYRHKYAVVSDGVLNIGLHDREFRSPSVCIIQPDLAQHARSMADHGFNFDFMRLEEDSFNEVADVDIDGHALTLVEARTFHADEEDDDDSLLGTHFEISLPVRDTMRAARFWGPVTQVVESIREEPTVHMRFEAGGIPVGLSESIGLEGASLCFKRVDPEPLQAVIEREQMSYRRYPGFEGALGVLVAPEGTHLYVFDEDFLGETISVEETDEPIPDDLLSD